MNHRLPQIWFNIQDHLFPHMQEEVGPLTPKIHQVIQTLELVRVEDYTGGYFVCVGRPKENRGVLN